MRNIVEHNRESWNRQSRCGSRWCEPVGSEVIRKAREGEWDVILTPNRKVPHSWFGNIKGKKTLCLASGGGQQAPVLAAAGARVTSYDNSEEQLSKDREVAERDKLELRTVRGDMADLGIFEDGRFELIFHPVSNVFAENLAPVWRECSRVLTNGGRLLSGFMNPVFYLFDHDELNETGEAIVKYSLPYADIRDLPENRLEDMVRKKEVFEFGHTLEQQIGGQIDAGLAIAGMYEDGWDDEATKLNVYTNTFIATLAIKHDWGAT